MKRKFFVLLSLILVVAALFSISVSAKANLPTISNSKPIVCYTYDSTGKVYAYTDASLKTKTGGYIACATDECKILEIKGNAVKVKYPVANGNFKTAWFFRNEFTYRDLANDAAQSTFTAKASATVYKWKGNSAKLGSVASKDFCYLLRGDEKSDWLQIIYPISGGYKMGWVKGVDYLRMIGKKTVSKTDDTKENTSSWQYPMNNYRITNNWNAYSTTKARDGRPYHCGIDMVSTKTTIYAAADGTVVYKGYTGANGYHIVLSHKIGNTTVKTLYSHLSSYEACPNKGKTVKKGAAIGVMGDTGYSTGAHLHFAIFTGSTTDPYGYLKNSGKYKIDQNEYITFYNPEYVIQNNKLP